MIDRLRENKRELIILGVSLLVIIIFSVYNIFFKERKIVKMDPKKIEKVDEATDEVVASQKEIQQNQEAKREEEKSLPKTENLGLNGYTLKGENKLDVCGNDKEQIINQIKTQFGVDSNLIIDFSEVIVEQNEYGTNTYTINFSQTNNNNETKDFSMIYEDGQFNISMVNK